MNSDQIYTLIDHIAATPGKNDKIALVTANVNDPVFKEVLRATYNPLITYGVRKFLPLPGAGAHPFGEETWHLIDLLATRNLTGTAALNAIRAEMCRLTQPSAELLRRILLKDMRAGFDAETCNKAQKGLIPDFPYMRCSLPKHVKMDEFFKGSAVIQEKADGLYMNIDHSLDDEVRLSSRAGTEYPIEAFAELVASVRRSITAGTQLHGEMLVVRDGVICKRADGNGVLNHVAAGGDFADNERPLFLAWDQIPLDAAVPKGKYTVPYKTRLATLVEQVRATGSTIRLIETQVVISMTHALAFNRKKLLEGKEGSVVKKLTAIWKDGTSREQIKLKVEFEFEARVKGFNEGTGKYAGQLGSLICVSECGELEFSVSGRGDKMRADFKMEDWQDAIVTVKGNDIMAPSESNPKHSIFLPIFIERRTDKTTADDLPRVREQLQATLEAA
jgi:DNA ligase-1